MSSKLKLVEDFSGMRFLNSPFVTEDSQFLKVAIRPVNAHAIAIFMLFVLLILVAIAFVTGGSKGAVFVFLLNPNSLDIHKLPNPMSAQFTAVSRFVDAAEGQPGITFDQPVNKNGAAFNPVDKLFLLHFIIGPDTGP